MVLTPTNNMRNVGLNRKVEYREKVAEECKKLKENNVKQRGK
jgi:hypothetical protein